MLHRTVWDAPSASSKKKLVSKLGTGVGYVTSNCMGRAVRQFEKKVGFKLGIGVGNVTWTRMGRAVWQYDKEVSFRLETGV